MSWIGTQRLASLVADTMLTQGLDERQRKASEAELRFERENALNFGDCLISLISQTCAAPSIDESAASLCLALSMMLEGLIKDGWLDGASFSDKPMVLQMLDQLRAELEQILNTSASSQQLAAGFGGGGLCQGSGAHTQLRKLMRVVAACLARICAIEFPSNVWLEYVNSQGEKLATAAHEGGELPAALQLTEICSLAHDNVELWSHLSAQLIPQLLMGAASAEAAIPIPVLELLHKLMEKRPPARQVSDAASNPLLVENSPVVYLLIEQLTARDGAAFVHALTSADPGVAPSTALLNELQREKLLVGTLWRFPFTRTAHSALLQVVFARLSALSAAYSQLSEATVYGTAGLALVEYSTELLECAQCVLIMSNESFTVVPPRDVFTTVLPFLVDVFDISGVGSDEQLLSDALDEDAVPAGAASGSPSNLSTSIIQLYIEFDQSTLMDFSSCWRESAERISTADHDTFCRCWHALGMALAAMAKQCDVDGVSILDAVPDATDIFLTSIGGVLSNMTEIPSELTARLLAVMGATMKLSQNIECCQRALQYVVDIVEAHTDDRPINITSSAVLAASKVLSASTQACQSLSTRVPFSVVEAAMWVSECGGPLGGYCGATALVTTAELCPQWNAPMVTSGRLDGVVRALVGLSGNVAFSQLLNKLLRTLIDEVKESVELVSAVAALCDIVLQDASEDSTRPTCRVAAELLQLMSIDAMYASQPVTLHMAAFVAHIAIHGPHGDALLRCFAVALATFAATRAVEGAGFQEEICDAAWQLVHEAATEHCNTATLSTAALALGTVVIRVPDTVHRLQQERQGQQEQRFHLLGECVDAIMAHAASKGRDHNYVGACFLAAVLGHMGGLSAFLSEVEVRAGDPHQLQALADFWCLWASLLPLCDRRTQSYSIVLWLSIVDRLMQGSESEAVAHFFSAPEAVQLRRVPSANTKLTRDLPSVGLSVLDAIRTTMAIIAFEQELGGAANKLLSFLQRDAFEETLSLAHALPPSSARDTVLHEGLFQACAQCVRGLSAAFSPGSLDANLRALSYTVSVEQLL